MTTSPLQPKVLKTTHALSTGLSKTASRFDLGGQRVKLETEPSAACAGVVAQFKLRPKAATKLGRKENLVDCVTAPVRQSSYPEITKYLEKVKVPKKHYANATFFVVSAQRRTPKGTREDMILSARGVQVAKGEDFLLGIALIGEEFRLLLIPKGKKGAISIASSRLGQALHDDDDDGDTSTDTTDTTTYPDDPTQDFAACYKDCMENVPEWLIAVVGGICTACVAAIGGLAAGGVTAPVVIATCSVCAVAVGVVLGNCLLTCHEMLGQ